MQSKSIIFTLAFVVLYTFTTFGQTFKTEEGQDFPSFEAIDIDGQAISTEALHERPSLIIFFGTRCPPCLKELKVLNRRIPADWYESFNIWMIGATDIAASLQDYREKKGYSFTFIADPGQELFNLVADHTIPRTFLVDKNGKILKQHVKYHPGHLEEILTQMAALVE